MKITQDPKYDCDDAGNIINRHSKQPIPVDEPIFIFRARDVHAREALEAYACVLYPGEHRDAVVQRIADFARFSERHPERMKEPDTATNAATVEDGDLYYLQESRSHGSSDMLFWAEGSRGYTTDVSRAHVYTREQAFAKHRVRETDIPWPKAYIDARCRPAVDFQNVCRKEVEAQTKRSPLLRPSLTADDLLRTIGPSPVPPGPPQDDGLPRKTLKPSDLIRVPSAPAGVDVDALNEIARALEKQGNLALSQQLLRAIAEGGVFR